MAEPARRGATYDDLLAAPRHLVAEIVGGELVTSPRPASGHARVATMLGANLVAPFDRELGGGGRPGGWWILFEPEVHLGQDVMVPDLAGWRREKMPEFPEDAPFFTQAPDWVCEVLSPSTVRFDRIRKLPVYAAARVGHAWLVDPSARMLEVFRLHDEHWLLVAQFAESALVRAEPFVEAELDLSLWWPPGA